MREKLVIFWGIVGTLDPLETVVGDELWDDILRRLPLSSKGPRLGL